MLKMFQLNGPSRKELLRRIDVLTKSNNAITDKAFSEMVRAENLDRELIAAKADRRNMEAEVERLKIENASLQASVKEGGRIIRRTTNARITTPLESAQKRAEMEGVDKVTPGNIVTFHDIDAVMLAKHHRAHRFEGKVMIPVDAGMSGQYRQAAVEDHPDYTKAKAAYDKALKQKKENRSLLAVLTATRTRLMADGYR